MSLFCPAPEFLDLPVHAGDLGFLLRDFRLEAVLGLQLGLVAHSGKCLLYLRLDRELDLALGIVELALLTEHVRLNFLGRSQLLVVSCEHLLQICQPPVALAEFIGDRQACSLCFRFDDTGPLRLQFCGDLLVDGLASFRDFFAGLLEQRFAPAKVRFLGSKLLVELAARFGNQGSRERFC